MTTRKVPKKMSMPSKKPGRPKSLRKLLEEYEARTQKRFDALPEEIDRRIVANNATIFAEIDRRIVANNAIIFAEIDRRIAANNAVIFAEFEAIGARLLKAQQESFGSQFGALDDKYRDIPERVTTLEDRVGITR
jgi:hypothetical protein